MTGVDAAPQRLPAGLPVGGGWGRTVEQRPVVFPYDASVVAQAPWGSIEDTDTALAAAAGAVTVAAALPAHERRRILMAVAGGVREHGVKDSGNGREGPRFAMQELTVIKMIMVRP